MKRVIIITREGEYPVNSIAYQQYSSEKFESRSKNLHCCIEKFITEIYDNEDEDYAHKYWDPLTTTGILPSYNEMFLGGEYDNLHKKSGTTEKFLEWLRTEITEKVKQAIEPNESPREHEEIDNRPYIHIEYNNFDIHFVFLNRIFDTFVNGPEEYDALVNDEHRLEFIKAICEDCGLEAIVESNESSKERAILYIHDKEWYKSDKSYSVLLKGEYYNDEGLNDTNKRELAKYFSTIKVFLHNENHIFNEIKRLDFTEEDEEIVILKRGYF